MSEPAPPLTARQILLEAARLVRQGWTQKRFVYDTDLGVCYCAKGALNKVCTGDPGRTYSDAVAHDAHIALRSEVSIADGYHCTNLVGWNDRPYQTAENVATTMERAALRLPEAT